MNEYVAFVQNHLLLVVGFVGVLGFTIWLEFNRLTRKYKQLDTTQAVRLLNDDNTIVIDVREGNEVSAGKIKGARHIPLGQVATRVGELEKFKDQPILVYCRSGNRSAMAANTLTKKGFTNVNNLAGGITSWESANLPVSKK
ncbi:MAG: rhodanese-like domain-containing protein [Thiofilum sp.]|uniref:rhodanese-like domain-containing protein n=1 Tax=Thiofilum sp. TaxID=2212733 RepID=UPI0025FFDA6E|nr:rhodanese-like domain-containing protein [Thiofilum sp.]MBK8452932.1 rhodanese-like domain-containing protein [Thiofilum sp.]